MVGVVDSEAILEDQLGFLSLSAQFQIRGGAAFCMMCAAGDLVTSPADRRTQTAHPFGGLAAPGKAPRSPTSRAWEKERGAKCEKRWEF